VRKSWIFPLILLASGASGADMAGASPDIAVVNGAPISLRTLENELLSREGADLVEDLVHKQLGKTDWDRLKDDDVVVSIGEWRMRRGLLAAQLLASNAAKVREELINIALVKQALAKAGVSIDQAAIDAEVKRMDARLQESLKKKSQPQVEFATFIEQTQQMPLKEFTEQPGFHMLVGLHLIAQSRGELETSEEDLRSYFDAHLDHYRKKEAVSCSLIFIPYKAEEVDGKLHVAVEERARLLEVMQLIAKSVRSGATSFAKAWAAYGRSYDQHSRDGGLIGWVQRDGKREDAGARTLPPATIAAAFAVTGPFPQLLEPIPGPDGVDIVLVHERRPHQEPDFVSRRAEILDDYLTVDLEARTQSLLNDLRRNSTIDYVSLPTLIEAREQAAGIRHEGGKP
jgi:hypothetical protein